MVEPQILLMEEPFGALETRTTINLHAELGVIGIVMALGFKQVETRLLGWRPEYRRRA